MEKNVEAICRVCLSEYQSRYISLKDDMQQDTEENPVSYAVAYTSCTQLEVLVDVDRLPAWLCISCSCDLKSAYEFRSKARKSFQMLCHQLELARHEYVGRVATPSEFALPDNNDADLMVACSMKDENCARDPLDDCENENYSKSKLDTLNMGLQSPAYDTFSELMFDSEDDKPLQQSTDKNDVNMDTLENFPNSKELSDLAFSYDDDDDFLVDKDCANDKVTDAMFSPEAQIFLRGRYKCSICEHRYFTPIGLKAHMEVHKAKKKHTSHNINAKKPIKARTETVVHSSDLNTSNTSTPDVTCDLEKTSCEDNVVSKEPKEAARVNESNAPKKKVPKQKRMLPCKVCGKEFISASKLRYHMVMHTGERNFLCTMCPNSYTTIYGLRHHIRSHTGERPYECKFCGDRFLRTTTLKSHQRRHTGERPYGCDICGKRFIQHSSMATHMRLNHMDKTIQCPHCIKKYARQTDLNAHLLSHTGNKPFRCQLCPSRFVRQSNLNKHMNQQHTHKEPKVANMVENSSNPAGSGIDFVESSFDFTSTENISNEEPTHILENEDLNELVMIDSFGI